MGILHCPLPIPCQKLNNEEEEEETNNNYQEHYQYHSNENSSSSSLLSQASLPSVPSLTPPFSSSHHHHHQQQYSSNSDNKYSHELSSTLQGHTSYVFSIAAAAAATGGKYFYTGSSDGEIRRWNRYPNKQDTITTSSVLVAEVHGSGVKSIVVLGDDKLFTAHHDHKIRIWKIDKLTTAPAKYRCIATLPTLNERCTKLFSAKNYVEVRRNKKCTWVHHVDAVSALALTKDKEFLYSVSWDRSFKLWRTSDFKCLESVQNAHDDAINAIVLSDDGYVYTGSADKKMKVWKKEQGRSEKEKSGRIISHTLVATLEKHKSAVNALALSSDGSVLYSGACDRSIIVWEKEDGGGGHMGVSGALRGHTKAILCLVVVSELVVSGSADKTVRVWRRSDGIGIGNGKIKYDCLGVFDGHRGPVKCISAAAAAEGYSGDDSGEISYMIYSGSLDFDVRVWKIRVSSNNNTQQ